MSWHVLPIRSLGSIPVNSDNALFALMILESLSWMDMKSDIELKVLCHSLAAFISLPSKWILSISQPPFLQKFLVLTLPFPDF